jgi:inhibitor of KinA
MLLMPLGDRAVMAQFGEGISTDVNARVKAFARMLEDYPFPGLKEIVPTYTTVVAHYDSYEIYLEIERLAEMGYGRESNKKDRFHTNVPFELVCLWLQEREQMMERFEVLEQSHKPAIAERLIEVPVCYGGALGVDLAEVAAFHSMTEQEVIAAHSEITYFVYMMGFTPGFAYMGGLPLRLATPRKSVPRTSVPAGSVGIGGGQTGIYPLETPGGWQVIGRTPLRLFLPECDPPTLLRAGDSVKFVPITQEQYWELKDKSMNETGILI